MIVERHEFASDNVAPICPEAWAALQEANVDYAPSYGEDRWTARVCGRGPMADKIDIGQVEALLARHNELHSHKPGAISIAQATEFGTVYTRDEIVAIADLARTHRLFLHMDGARFANAIASLKCAPKAITWNAGVDVLCFGGTKNGVAVGELLIFFDRKISREFDYRAKQAGQRIEDAFSRCAVAGTFDWGRLAVERAACQPGMHAALRAVCDRRQGSRPHFQSRQTQCLCRWMSDSPAVSTRAAGVL